MHVREFEPLYGVLAEADEPLTAREILSLLEGREEFDSSHRVATVLGRLADRGEVEVITGSPYRYRLDIDAASRRDARTRRFERSPVG